MSRRGKIVKKWATVEKLEKEIKNKRIEAKMLLRLLFIREVYKGTSVPKSCEYVGVWKATGYNWLRAWNEKGIEGLKPKFDGGPKPRINKVQKENLIIELKQRDDWTTKEIQQLIQDRFNVSYTGRHVNRLLKSFGMNHGKPFQNDYRRPDDAEEQLKKISMKHSQQ